MRLGFFGRLGGVTAAGVIASSAWGAGGCAANKQTELVPGVMSQIQVPRNLQVVRVDVQAQGVAGSSCYIQSVDPLTGGVTLPRTLGVVPDGDDGRLVTVTVTGYSLPEGAPNVPSLGDCLASPFQDPMSAAAVKILRRSRQRYVGGKILFLPMPLRYSCWEAAQCKDDETCVAGACVPAAIDSATLTEFRSDLIDGTSNTCFSAKQCFADAVVAAKVVDAATCTYAYPLPSAPLGSGVNVRVYYDHGESEILDVDDASTPENLREGFTIPDASKPQQFKLAKALCDMVKGTSTSPRRIIEVRMGTVCTPKTVLQPICAEDQHDPHSLPDGGQTTDGSCNISSNLQPAPSALYVLLDNAKAMAPIYGPAGLSKVLSFSLADPVFRTTALQFKLLPHAAADCTVVPPGPTTYSMSPDVSFDLASKVQGPIGTIVGDTNKPLTTDPPLYLDAALQPNGAYKALLDFRGTKAFNRMAVMLIVNRTIGDDCGSGHAMAVAEAAAAFNSANAGDRIYTYVVMLGNTAGGQDATTAQAIATAGGPTGAKQFFDARSDGSAGPRAFTTVVSDLGSCLYEKPANIDAGAVIAYTDPLSQQTTNVAFNMGCNEAAQNTSDGWNIDNGRVRICGKACSDLRTVLMNAAGFAALQSLPAPDVPVTATQPCK